VTASESTARIEIRSAGSERFKSLLALARSARERQTRQLALIEGEHLLQAWLDAGGKRLPEVVIPRRTSDRADLAIVCERAADRTLVLDDPLYDRLSQVEHGPGPLAVIPIPHGAMPARLDHDAIYLDGIQDPGNAGTVIRSAAAFGVGQVLSSPSTVGLWSPKVVRAAMGAHFALRICEGVSAELLLARQGSALFTVAAPRSACSIDEADLKRPRIWIFGAEGQGVCAELLDAHQVMHLQIAQQPEVESLNVGVAASVCLYEQFRQRRASRDDQLKLRDSIR